MSAAWWQRADRGPTSAELRAHALELGQGAPAVASCPRGDDCPLTRGAEWCYAGNHGTVPPDADELFGPEYPV